ncbi:MAG: hypothetical protein Q7S31_00795 [bacterium]|nr:hypothetical protein [bacterium]
MTLPESSFWRIFVVVGLVVGLAVGVMLVRQRQLTQTSAKYTELEALPVNVTDTSIGIWWRSDNLSPGCVDLVDIDTRQTFSQCEETAALNHLVNVSGLTPSAKYEVQISSGGNTVLLSPFFGAYIQTSARPDFLAPQLVIGKVTVSDSSLSNATVFVGLDLSDHFRFPLAVKTAADGTFTADLAKLAYFSPPPYSAYFVEVTDSTGLKLTEVSLGVAEVDINGINLNIK